MMEGKEAIIQEVLRVLELEGNAILECRARASQQGAADSLARAVELLKTAVESGGKIIVTGLGKSGKISQKIAATFSSTGSLAVFLHPTEGLHGDLGLVQPQDAVLILSHSGNTTEILQLLPSLKSLRVPIIGMGGNPQSALAQASSLWIDCAVQEEACPHKLAPTTSTTLALAMGDALAVALMKVRKIKKETFAQYHPGGSLGRRLSLRVADLMHSGEAVPTVLPDDAIDTVIMRSTEKKLGAVLVVSDRKLLGIITDGDLRRALRHREQFFNFKAKDVMTPNPISIESNVMAQEALTLMEARSSQISVLPVIHPKTQEWEGLLRLHDLVRSL